MVTVTAVANTGYTFVNWMEGEVEVADTAEYSFTAMGHRTLTAHFEPEVATPENRIYLPFNANLCECATKFLSTMKKKIKKRKRILNIQADERPVKKKIPWLLITGGWVKKAGFMANGRVMVKVKPGKLTLKPM